MHNIKIAKLYVISLLICVSISIGNPPLRQNAKQMQIQMEELILRWQSYLLMINKRVDDLEEIDRNLDRLQIVRYDFT